MTDPPERAASAEPAGPEQPEEGATGTGSADPPRESAGRRPQRQRKQLLLRLDPAIHDALARWAADELRSTNAQIDYLLRKALADARRLPGNARPHPRRGRPPREE
ncbi:hypothetical protein [Streptomyces albidus (ex Kaewkla and Franco 2021)]|uniref:hypothetical protein n=1 Tax=Streptomyces albidus (ex Kaewkla and Franco 2022) TaxID=722709 RepID=UPI0015EFA06F